MEEVNYKEMYLMLMRATNKAVNLLIKAQQECEELYLASTENAPSENDSMLEE